MIKKGRFDFIKARRHNAHQSDKVESHEKNNKWLKYLTHLGVSLGLSMLIGSVIILLVGQNPLTVYSALILEAFFSPRGLMIAVQRATPLILVSGAAVIAFQGGAINMGLQGQFVVGAAIAAVVGYALPEMPKVFAIPIVLVFCAIGGAAAGWIPAFFKMVSGVNEVITGMIANLLIPSLLSILLGLPFLRSMRAGASQYGIQTWVQFSQFNDLTNGRLGFGTKANTAIFLAIGLVLLLGYWIKRTKIGYEIRISSANFSFAEFAGINANRSFYITMMLSGAVAAISGATEILGVWRVYNTRTIALGYNGLLLALVGGNTYFGSLLASFIYGGLQAGALSASWHTAIPRPLIDVLVEFIVIFTAIPSMRLFFSGAGHTENERLGGQFTQSR